jgi:hypothetical protein
VTPPRSPDDGARERQAGVPLAQALRLGMAVELAGSPEEVRRAVQAYWRAGLEAPRAVVARAIARLLDMGERPGRVDVCPVCGSPLCLWCRRRAAP